VEVYSVDTALLKELRDLEKQAAQELGQWTAKTEIVTDEKPRRILIPDADDRREPEDPR
jgi:hypothetical protein